MTWINYSKLKYSTIDKLLYRNKRIPQVDYEDLAKKLVDVPLPYTIMMKIEPQTKTNAERVRKNIHLWFWRHFGTEYANFAVKEEDNELWLVVWRGKAWYKPFEGYVKNKVPLVQLTCELCGTSFSRKRSYAGRGKHEFCTSACAKKYHNKCKSL